MKNIQSKSKKIILILILSFVAFFPILTIIMTVPGMGIESLTFINSVEKQIKRIMPKNKFVFDPNHPLYEEMMENVIKPSFKADALSTINFEDSHEKEEFYLKYSNYSEEWYKKHWAEKVKNKEQIDLYDIGLNFIEFDKSVAEEFQSFGFVNTGIQWMFKSGGLKEIFSKNTYEMSLRQQTILDQSDYDDQMKYSGPGLNGIKIKHSVGTKIVNNKVWFLNTQIDSIKFALKLTNPFMDKTLSKDQNIRYVTVNDLKWPNFTSTLVFLRFSAVVIFFNIVIIPGGIGLFLILRKKWNK
ncbi:hypothetical protein [Spiroplasma cantharicola]|uniref:Uncharacterized protein n=1 Tax=Spiroplasma cantharicola TaxID=362837 RepID=A0A0M4JWG3_9MOLU|nr:hypothetical protein [Spiroplasma cantharicola]ALD66280.1 hypothetical protein SCANT_v1c03700 [Spiroplasma cantharicola]